MINPKNGHSNLKLGEFFVTEIGLVAAVCVLAREGTAGQSSVGKQADAVLDSARMRRACFRRPVLV